MSGGDGEGEKSYGGVGMGQQDSSPLGLARLNDPPRKAVKAGKQSAGRKGGAGSKFSGLHTCWEPKQQSGWVGGAGREVERGLRWWSRTTPSTHLSVSRRGGGGGCP